MKPPIRIGTRDSALALWQANHVKNRLEAAGIHSVLVPVKSHGDINLTQPLYELGITGVFTKTLDAALLSNNIDIAVHSLKDVPTQLPEGIVQTAVLERASYEDILVFNNEPDLHADCTIATGSLRRRAQWLHRYPHHQVVGLRGNVNTRLKKLVDSDWQGAVFAKAGLERIEVLPKTHFELNWMLPAPAQGAMVIVARENDDKHITVTQSLNHRETALCTMVEREFLRTLEGGCSAPIGALATIEGSNLNFEGVLLSLDGSQRIHLERNCALDALDGFGMACAREVLQSGGHGIMKQIKNAT